MSKTIDTGMLELLASKICHDLISPIGAVNNGVEFLEDMGAGAGPEATELISFSAQQASAKLQAFRLAYGAGGADGNIKAEDVYKTIQLVIEADKKVTQDWDAHGKLGAPQEKRGFCKMLTCTLLLAIEALPKGGVISVAGGNDVTIVHAKGVNASLRGHAEDALNGKVEQENLEPQDVHAFMTGLLAAHYGFKISVRESGDGFLELQIL